MLWSWNDFALHLPQSMCKAVSEINTTMNFSFFAFSVLFFSLIPKLAVVLNAPPGKYKEMCWSLSSHNFIWSLSYFLLFGGFFFQLWVTDFIAILFKVMLNVAQTLSEGCTMCLWVNTTRKRKYIVSPCSVTKQCISSEREKTWKKARIRIETVSGHKQVTWSCKIMED